MLIAYSFFFFLQTATFDIGQRKQYRTLYETVINDYLKKCSPEKNPYISMKKLKNELVNILNNFQKFKNLTSWFYWCDNPS